MTPLTPVQQKLVEDYYYLIEELIPTDADQSEKDEMLSDGGEGLCSIISSLNPDELIDTETYLRVALSEYMLRGTFERVITEYIEAPTLIHTMHDSESLSTEDSCLNSIYIREAIANARAYFNCRDTKLSNKERHVANLILDGYPNRYIVITANTGVINVKRMRNKVCQYLKSQLEC